MELKDTYKLMTSDDYKDRFVAEYLQTKIRYQKLHDLVIKAKANALDFELTTPLEVLIDQKRTMGQYLEMLEIRAVFENVDLVLKEETE